MDKRLLVVGHVIAFHLVEKNACDMTRLFKAVNAVSPILMSKEFVPDPDDFGPDGPNLQKKRCTTLALGNINERRPPITALGVELPTALR